jgi:hypothetical protein
MDANNLAPCNANCTIVITGNINFTLNSYT